MTLDLECIKGELNPRRVETTFTQYSEKGNDPGCHYPIDAFSFVNVFRSTLHIVE